MDVFFSDKMAKRAKRGNNHFQLDWLDRVDDNSDKIGDYLIKVGEYSAKCIYCKTDISLGNMGFSAIRAHFRSAKHRNVADFRKKRVSGQLILDKPTNNTEDADDPDPIGDCIDKSHSIEDANVVNTAPAVSNSNRNGLMRYFTSIPQAQVTTENNNNTAKFIKWPFWGHLPMGGEHGR